MVEERAATLFARRAAAPDAAVWNPMQGSCSAAVNPRLPGLCQGGPCPQEAQDAGRGVPALAACNVCQKRAYRVLCTAPQATWPEVSGCECS